MKLSSAFLMLFALFGAIGQVAGEDTAPIASNHVLSDQIQNSCAGYDDVRILSGVYAGSYLCGATNSIETDPGVVVAADSDIHLYAPQIWLAGSFSLSDSATLSAGKALPGILNPGLSGKLLFQTEEKYWTMDVATGADYRIVPHTDWGHQDDPWRSEVAPDYVLDSFWAGPPSSDYKEFAVATLDNCVRVDYGYVTCVAVQDFQGNYNSYFRFDAHASSAPQLSRDRKYVAIIVRYFGSEEFLVIFDRKGHKISEKYLGYYTDFVWLSGNRLLYAAGTGRKFYITNPLSTEPDRQLSLPDRVPGSIGYTSLSPDGKRLAFVLKNSDGYSPWVMNVDGQRLWHLAVEASPPNRISIPQWSPDGKHILLRTGAYTGLNVGNPGHFGIAFVVPSTPPGGKPKPYILSIVDSERSPEVMILRRRDYDFDSEKVYNSIIKDAYVPNLAWWVP